MFPNPSPKPNWTNWLLFLLLALVWSGSFINIKIVVSTLPPIFCAFVRVLISFIALILLFLCKRKKLFLQLKNCWVLWIAGLFTQAIPFALLFFGEQFIAPALASIINSTVTIWSLILGVAVFHDMSQWTSKKIAGIFLSFIGIVVIFLPFIGHENSLIGVIAVMGMAVSYAIGGLISQHLIFKTQKISFEINLIQQHVSSVLFLLFTSLMLESWPSWSSLFNLKLLGAFLYLSIIATAIAWIIYFYLIREWNAVRAASVTYLVPVLAIIWDALFLNLMPSLNELVGMSSILVGIVLIQWAKS